MPSPATIRDELASVSEIAGFNLDRAAERIAMLRQLRVRADMERAGYDLKAYVRALPVTEQLDLVDFLAHQLSWSYGSDQIGRGADFIRDELAEEAANAADRGRA